MSAKPWAVYDKYGREIIRFANKMQADHYAKTIANGATVHHVC